jgi:hypothetical protein
MPPPAAAPVQASTRPPRAERALVWLLRILGGVTLCALVPAVMPTNWMERVNDWLGLGPFPRAPLTEYLTRSLSLLYALLGAFVLYVSTDVPRYRELIVFIGWLTIVLGSGLTVLDFAIGMPASWSWTEGPPTILCGAAFIHLARP